MALTKQNDDLFEGTKMTFGEHLEELRICLVKSLFGLGVGLIFGFIVADDVVRFIEGPLQAALQNFYQEKAKHELTARYGEIPSQFLEFVQEHQLIFEDVYWEASELKRIEQQREAFAAGRSTGTAPTVTGEAPPPPRGPLVRTRIWRPIHAEVTSLSAYEPFMVWMKAALITGTALASPWIFWQIWSFVAAGLYPQEKGYVYFFLPVSLGLFFAGAALAFFFVFQYVLAFLFEFNTMMRIDPDPRINDWMSFVLLLPLAFGVSFQLPLVMLILERLGIVTVATYLEKWRLALLIIFVVAMVLTPSQDPTSMLFLALPLSGLYFGGILLCKYLPKKKSPYGVGYDPQ
jgi:sec-independent protein translocase protein TatC